MVSKGKRGISAIVAVVLIILIVVSATTLVWQGVVMILSNLKDSDEISSEISIITVEGYTAWDEDLNRLSVQLGRSEGNDEIVALDFIFVVSGNSVIQRVEDVLEVNQRKIYNFCFDSLTELQVINVAPVYQDGEIGRAVGGLDKIPNGDLSSEDFVCIDLGMDDFGMDPIDVVYSEPVRNIVGGTASVTGLDLTKKTLVVYNGNYLYGEELAEYYASERGISSDYICEVKVETGQFADASYLTGMKNTILEDCICLLTDVSDCSAENVEEIAAASPIIHLALIKGIPPRLTGTGFVGCTVGDYGDRENPSLGFYLARTLYSTENIQDYDHGCFLNYPPYYGLNAPEITDVSQISTYGYLRELDPGFDKYVSHGYVEAMDPERTKELIDRTIAAEKNGVTGNYMYTYHSLEEDEQEDISYTFLRDLTSTEYCLGYVGDEDGGDWDSSGCRLAANDLGRIPGESGGNIANPLNAGIYIGNSHGATLDGNLFNWHNAFDGFGNMLNWHKSEKSCIELCKDTADPDACSASSTDYFKEINTDCVGVAEGFLGWQYRSFPVQYYGFWPGGWGHVSGGTGMFEKTPPVRMSDGGDNYIHFGMDNIDSPDCRTYEGSVVPCSEHIGLSLAQGITLDPVILIDSDTEFNFTLRHRNPENSNKKIRVYLFAHYTDGSSEYAPSQYIYLDDESSDWKDEILTFKLENEGKVLKTVYINILDSLSYAPEGWLDLDDIQLSLDGEILSDEDGGRFDRPYDATVEGDWASNVIDRLGGIAWWGSSSHHASGGHSFSWPYKILGAFYSGRSLGESVAHNSRNGVSGIVYGDPAYRPSGVKIYVEDNLSYIGDKDRGYVFTESEISDVKIYVNAFHGQGNFDSTLWKIEFCNTVSENPDCPNGWEEIVSGEGAVFEELIFDGLDDFIGPKNQPQYFTLRLSVWNPGEEKDMLSNYAYLYYEPDTDSDGLSDLFENFYFKNLDYSSGDDPDLDGFTNFEEFVHFKSPATKASFNYPLCYLDEHCPSEAPDCLEKTSRCMPCNNDNTCEELYPGDEPFCALSQGYCQACDWFHGPEASDAECAENHPGEPFCYYFSCRECRSDSDCSLKYPDDSSKSNCNDNGFCKSCSGDKISDPDCVGVEGKPDCSSDTCVDCIADSTCEANGEDLDYCLSRECVECTENAHCEAKFPDGSLSYCRFEKCVACTSHSDCTGEGEYCGFDNTCEVFSCETDSDCEDFDDCSLDSCNAQGYCEFEKITESEDCFYCANVSRFNHVGGFYMSGGVDINHNGRLESEDWAIWVVWRTSGGICNGSNDFCDYADVDRSQIGMAGPIFDRIFGVTQSDVDLLHEYYFIQAPDLPPPCKLEEEL